MTSHLTSPRLTRNCHHHAARRSSSAGCRSAQRPVRRADALVGERSLSLVVTDAAPAAPLVIELDDPRIERQIEAIADTAFFRELAGKAADMRSALHAPGAVHEPLRLAA